MTLRQRIARFVKRARVLAGQKISGNVAFVTGGSNSASGVNVTPETALEVPAMLSAVRAIAETMAQVPLNLHRVTEDSTTVASDLPLHHLVHQQPNPEITSFDWREMQQATLCTWGNAFSEIERDSFGTPTGLWPIPPNRVRVQRRKSEVVYLITVNGEEHLLRSDQMLHVKGFSQHGLLGLVITNLARDAIGTASAQEQYTGSFYANDASPGGYLQHPESLSEGAANRLMKRWNEDHQGLPRKHRISVLEEGLAFKEVGVSPQESELVAGRTFQVDEVARVLRIPPHMIQELSRATFSNIEAKAIEFVVHTMQPWVKRWEQRLKMMLLPRSDRSHEFKFNLDSLLRGDTKARSAFYRTLWNMGTLSANEIRKFEDQNPIENGDRYYVPLNMVAVGSADEEAALRQRMRGMSLSERLSLVHAGNNDRGWIGDDDETEKGNGNQA